MRKRRLTRTVFVVGEAGSETNERLSAAVAAAGTSAIVGGPDLVAGWAVPGDVVIGRLDVRPGLDGVQPGLGRLIRARERGVRVVNDANTLVATHDKLVTAVLLEVAGVPHPRTVRARHAATVPPFEPPYVVKPRYGSWGRDIFLCESWDELRACLRTLGGRLWFHRHGALVQELIPPRGFDVRLIVSDGEVVGAIERVSAPGEWRTNIALGGTRRPTEPSSEARELAERAAAAVGGDLVGVDLLPEGDGWRVIEINGAVDFTDDYALDEQDVFARAVAPFVPPALRLLAPAVPAARPVPSSAA